MHRTMGYVQLYLVSSCKIKKTSRFLIFDHIKSGRTLLRHYGAQAETRQSRSLSRRHCRLEMPMRCSQLGLAAHCACDHVNREARHYAINLCTCTWVERRFKVSTCVYANPRFAAPTKELSLFGDRIGTVPTSKSFWAAPDITRVPTTIGVKLENLVLAAILDGKMASMEKIAIEDYMDEAQLPRKMQWPGLEYFRTQQKTQRPYISESQR